jgi:hypothetical protein
MYTLMYYQIALLTECFITHLTGIRVITTMDALMCCQSALSSECLITYCTAIKAFTIMYITGRSVFSTVYVKLFIQSTLLKTQRLNIRIYSDRKPFIFTVMFILHVSKSVAWYQNYVHIKICVERGYIHIYTQSLEVDKDDFSTCNYTMAKLYCPISLMQKFMQKLVIRNINDETLG